MSSFCNVFLKKKFIKCISKKDETCYLFVGKIPFIRRIINKIKKNIKNDEGDPFQEIDDEEIISLYGHLIPNKTGEDNIDLQKEYLRRTMMLDWKKLVFVNESINEDDTNETILYKIIYNCYPEKQLVTLPYLYAWYYDSIQGKNIPVHFEYEGYVQYNDLDKDNVDELLDSSFIDGNGDKLPKQIINKGLILSEKSSIKDDKIYFYTLEDFLEGQEITKNFIEKSEEEIKQTKELKSFIHGILIKYWPNLTLLDILNFYKEDDHGIREIEYNKQRDILDVYSRHLYIIESEFLNKNVNEKINCDRYTLTLLKLNKFSSRTNTVHLSKLFSEFSLNRNVPFMKLLLNSHDDAFFKLYENSLMYEGTEKNSERYITKTLCKDWSDGYNIQTEYGYKYLHSGNIILFKVYNVEYDIYSTLIIHLNGDIECIIENNHYEISEREIKVMIEDCNSLIKQINTDQFYSFHEINTLDKDVLMNIHSDTKVDFLNSGILLNKDSFQNKYKKTFPNWDKLFGTFIQNFPMYLRVKTIMETEEESKIIGRYNRVDNYANITTIQSAIAAYKVIYEDPEIIIQKLSKDYGKDIDFIRNEYETWEELMSMKEDRRTSKIVNEGGSEIKLWLNTKEDLLIEIKNMKSFNEQRRVFVFIKTMLNMYLSYILNPKTALQRRLFEKVDAYVNEIYEDKDDVFEESVEEGIISSDSTDLSEELDLLEQLEDELDGEIDFSDIQGGGSYEEGIYETKSYYLKRLKEYDPDLFKFKSRRAQTSGVPYGYPKYCGAIDRRQPIAVNDEDLERIHDSYDHGSGRESYSEAISVPRRPGNIKYICPKYWDISTSLSIRPDAVDHSNIVPNKLPKGSNGRTDKSILERSAIYWTDANEVKFFEPNITEDSKQLHPMGYGLPCCFNVSKALKGDPERKRKKKDIVVGEGYISNKDPVAEGKYAHVHPSLLQYFGQNEHTFSKKKSSGFLKVGVKQNDNDYVFPISPFLQCYFKILSDDKIIEDDFIDIIEDKLTNHLDRFQKCPLIHQKFRKEYHHITEEDNQYVLNILDMENTKKLFNTGVIRSLRIEMEKKDIRSNETSYLYQLLLSLKNYIDFLRSDENKDDKYLLPVLLHLYEINIVIFENRNDEIKIKVSDYTRSNKFGFIYQRGNYYEPILYRYYDNISKSIKEVFSFTPDLLTNEHYEVIMQDIHQKVEEKTKVSKIIEYEEIIESIDDKLITLMVDNYSFVNYLITKKGKIIPIQPEPIPMYKNYTIIYSFLEISSIRVGMKVKVGPLKRRVHGKINSLPFGKKGREKVSILSDEGREYPSVLCRNICFLDEDRCMSLLPRYENAIEYLKHFKRYFSIESVLRSEEGGITSILLSNDTYLPVIEEEVQSGFPSVNGFDLLQIENSLYRINNEDDSRELFIKQKNYEEYITKLAIQHILSTLEKTTINVKGFLEDPTLYKEGDKIYFVKKKEEINKIVFHFIEKLDKMEYIYSQFDENYSLEGVIKEIKESKKVVSKYPVLSEINIEVKLLDKVSFILNDPIMLIPHKKLKIYEVIDEYINPLFYLLNERDYQQYELDRYITLCNENNELCNYPCKKANGKCKLYVREKDRYGNLLVEKIKWKFIEKLIIYGVEERDKIIQETISLNELSKSTKLDEIFYTFSDYKNDILNEVFTKRSKYIRGGGKGNLSTQKTNHFMKKLDSIPYYIQRLFGKDANVIFHLDKQNNDFLSLEKALNECDIHYDKDSLQSILIEELEMNNNTKFLKKYKEGYTNVNEIIQKIKQGRYHLQPPDFELIIQYLGGEEYRLGIIVISQNERKKNDIYFYSTSLDIMDIETAPIIAFHHTLYKEEYILSNILVNNDNELEYHTTIRNLYDKNPIHKKWIQIIE